MPILEDGQLFERYRVHRWLGSGIAGESYEAEDRILQRKVTLKLIHPWATLSDSARRQFFREMQGISLLNHPYLATVLDYGETDGRIYVARRYVSSGSLLGTNGRLWFHPPLVVADAFKYAHQLAQALQYIHQHGYLHGSFTFANVLVLRGPNTEHNTDYAPFLMADIGLAHFVRRFGHPRIETLPVSAAPEQLSRRVAPASDQFALAVLLYFWLAGRPPYLGTPNEVEQQKLSETITPLSILNPGITLEQDSIILRALTAYPEDRHASVLAFAEELITSLTSTNRLYAPVFTPQSETPQINQHSVQDKVPANTLETREQAEASQPTQTSAQAPTEETPTSTPSSQVKAEPYRSALEELLALPQTSTNDGDSDKETSRASGEENKEELDRLQQEELTLLPDLPETPPVGEITTQSDFAFIASGETSEQQISRQTGPLAVEPPVDALYARDDEPAIEMSLDLPDSTDSLSLDELPPAPEVTGSWLDEPLSSVEEETPTIPREEFARIRRENELLLAANESALLHESASLSPTESAQVDEVSRPGEPLPASEETALILPGNELPDVSKKPETSLPSDESAPLGEVSTPITSPNIPLLSKEEEDSTTPQQEFAVDEEGFVIFSLDELSSINELISPVVFPDEPFPTSEEATLTIPLEEPAAANTNTPAPSSSEPLVPSDEESAPAIPLAENFQKKDEHTPTSLEAADGYTKDAPGQTETANASPSDALDLAKIADLPMETPPTPEGRVPTIPLTERPTTPEEDAHSHPSDKSALPDEVNEHADLQAELSLVNEGAPILSGEPPENDISDTPMPLLDMEVTQPSHISAPMQEASETNNATYPPIDEAIIAPRLIISSPYTSSSYEFLLIGEETNIGRAGASDLYLEQDNLTSRHHALLKRIGERVLIFDKRSHNGIFLNGQKIEAGRGYELADGDHIGIGNYELIFRSAPAGHVSQLI